MDICILILAASVEGYGSLSFPPTFKFGVATSAYQIEGAWNVSDKTDSVWDCVSHSGTFKTADNSTGDVACDSYRLYREDVKLAAQLGVHFYRFSISWSRVLPSGFNDHISEDGSRYYNSLIDELLSRGIQPLVTMYHWDLPQALQELGGWTNPRIVEWFADYARVLFILYGDRVKNWITINEPIIVCDLAYAAKLVDPGLVKPELASFVCSKYTMLAHATAWRIYDQEFRSKYHGRVSIANQIIWMEGRTPGDWRLGEMIMEYASGRYSHPIFSKDGGWPPKLEAAIKEHSIAEGYNVSRLPHFTAEEIKFIRGTYDYYALNYYTSRAVYPAKEGDHLAQFPFDDAPEFAARFEARPLWEYGASKILPIYPKGLRHTMKWINDKYGPIEILITENGYSSHGGDLKDRARIKYIRDHLEQVLLAIREDGINVAGYTYWSLLDNFEWMYGYTLKFGLYEVDFSSPERTRTPRSSAVYYADIIRQRELVATPHNSASNNLFKIAHSIVLVMLLVKIYGN